VALNDPSRPARLANPAAVDGARFDGGGCGLSAAGLNGDAGAGFITRSAGGLPMCGGSGRRPNAPARLERGILAVFGIVAVVTVAGSAGLFAGPCACSFAGPFGGSFAGPFTGSGRSGGFRMNGHSGIGMRL
jgi:hypothetical protein